MKFEDQLHAGKSYPPGDQMPQPKVISASRRTDIPAFYSGWLREALERCEVAFLPPRGGWRTVSLLPCEVHSIVLWSKNYAPLLADGKLCRLLQAYHPYFHLTVTGLGGTAWEPGVPPAARVLPQFDELAGRFGPERVCWRFDPLVFWPEGSGVRSNLEEFPRLAERVAAAGIRRCMLSFAQWYGKAVRRTVTAGQSWVDPPPDERLQALIRIAKETADLGLEVTTCADPSDLPPGVRHGACIDGPHLAELHPEGLRAATGKDISQRPACGCTPSIDIGSYRLSCGHGCLYCYANPATKPLRMETLETRQTPVGRVGVG